MPFNEGGSVAEIIRSKYQTGFKTEVLIASVLRSVLQGLQYLHGNGIVHRDIKCGNLLINSKGKVSICDFGISAGFNQANSSVKFAGTPCWMAPETLIESSGYEYKNDIWSVGICALELAEGTVPHANLQQKQVYNIL